MAAPAARAQTPVPATAAGSDSAFIAWLPVLARTVQPPNIDTGIRFAIVADDYRQALARIDSAGPTMFTLSYEIFAATRVLGDDSLMAVFLARRLCSSVT